jgi:hypothetical protein
MTQSNHGTDSTAGLSGSGLRVGQLPGETPDDAVTPSVAVPHHADGILNRKWAQNLLPLGSSLLFHLMLVAMGFGIYKTVVAVDSPNKEQVVIPDSHLVSASKPINLDGAMPRADNPTVLPQPAAMGTTSGNEDDVLAAAGTPSKELANFGVGPHETANHGAFGTSPDGGSPYGRFYGTPGVKGLGGGLINLRPGGDAHRIVYLCDCSGSMIGVFGAVKAEMKKSINTLVADRHGVQYFNVIFFSDGQPQVLFKDGLGVANAANKKLAFEFIDDAVAGGGTIPLPAIKAAFASSPKPDLVWVMTDGFDNVASFDEVVDTFKKNTADGQTHVNCFFFESDPDPKLVEVLTAIAKNGHGNLSTIMKADMQ